MKRFLCLSLTLCVILLGFAACGAKNSDGSYEIYSVDESYGTTGNGPQGISLSAEVSDRKLIRDADLTVETKSFDELLTALDKQIEDMEGYVESSDVNNANRSRSYRSANVVVRVPAEKLDDFIHAVGELGSVRYQSVRTRDITSEYIDTESRIAALKAEQQALIEMMSSATALKDILDIQDRLSSVTADLESYQAQMNSFDNLVTYSTVNLSVNEVELSPADGEQGFWGETGTRLLNNLAGIGKGARSFAMWLISSLPYLVLIAVCVLAVWAIVRHRIRRHKAKKAAQQNSSDR